MIDCKKIAIKKEREVIRNLTRLKKYLKPKLVILDPINSLESMAYIERKMVKADELGIQVELINSIKDEEDLKQWITKLNNDPSVHGYIIQFPLPPEYSLNSILEMIDPKKDVDGISKGNLVKTYLHDDKNFINPCTCEAILDVLNELDIHLENKNVVIVNRSIIIGKPLMQIMLNQNANVTVCHSFTRNVKKFTKCADILITAIGKPKMIRGSFIKKNCLVIDAGFSYSQNKISGDVNIKSVSKKTNYVTPVPGGVGLLTVINVFANLVKLIKLNLFN